MSNNAEEGIARIQAAVAQARGSEGLKEHHKWTIAYLDERILVFILAVAVMGLGVVWASTASPLLLYGSFGALILLVFTMGFRPNQTNRDFKTPACRTGRIMAS